MPASTPITVSANQGSLDVLMAAGRYVVVIIGAMPILIKLLGDKDFVGLVNYFRSADGTTLAAAGSALLALGWGLWKTRHRGAQIAKVAGNSRVPDSIAQIK